MLFLIGTFGLNFPIFIATMAVSVFHVDAFGYGLLSSSMAVGTVAGALLAAGRDRPRIRRADRGLGGVRARLRVRRAVARLLGVRAALAVIGVAALTVTNVSNSLMQLSTEPAMRGRVMALRVSVAWRHADRRADRRLDRRRLRAALGARCRRRRRARSRDRGGRGGRPGVASDRSDEAQ